MITGAGFHGTHLYANEIQEQTMTNRRTSAYTLTVPDVDDGDVLVARYVGIAAGSGPDTLVFRARNDEEAHEVADYVALGHSHTLHTGFGVHRRYLRGAQS